jgi:ubiquinone/menaquinone biosynthesis C-methylase UbiE
VRQHYDGLAAEYDEHWVYSPEYVPWMTARIADALQLRPSDRIADIGCGTGLFAKELARQLRPSHPILCVDPSEAMLEGLSVPPSPMLKPVVA